MGNNNNGIFLAVLLVIGALVGQSMGYWELPFMDEDKESVLEEENGGGFFTGTPTLGFSAQDYFAEGTSVTGGTVYYWKNGVYGTTTIGGTALNVADNDEFEIYMTNGTYYGYYTNHKVAQKPLETINAMLYPHATASSMGTFVENPDGTLNTASVNYSLVNGDNKNFKWVVNGHYQKAYGNPYVAEGMTKGGVPALNVIVFESNTSTVDAISIGGLTSATTPTQHSAGSTNSTWAFFMQPIKTNEEKSMIVNVDIDDTLQPIEADDSSQACGVIYDVEFYLHTVNNDIMAGVEDNDNSDVGITTHLSDCLHFR
jgi:hypothetical protein